MDHERKINLYKLKKAFASGQERVEAAPAVLYLEATASCNLRCPMCPTTIGLPRAPYRTKMFDMEILQKLEHLLPKVVRCFLSGGGEPLLHPRFFDMVALLKRRGLEVQFNSNATLVDEENSRRILDSGVDTISFSVDGASRETYESIRTPADFEKTVANIRRLSRMKKDAGSDRPFINMQFTLMDANAHEILQAVEMAASLGLNHLVIEPLTPVYCFDPEYEEFYKAHAVDADRVTPALREAEARAEELGLVFSSHYLFAADHPEPPARCIQPWLTLGVRVDGRVFACCGTIEPMGDLAGRSFEQVWNGDEYRALRRRLSKGRFPDFCRHCVIENRAGRFNQDLFQAAGE